MFTEKDVSRRDFLKKASLIGGIVPLVLTACGGESDTATTDSEVATTPEEVPATESSFACGDTSGLTDVEISQREAAAYVDISTMPDRNCLNCLFWESGTVSDACGACQVVKGPIHPLGYCNLWQPQAAG